MANVARESAEDVSQQLTAVWNNFAKGGESLEYYADVMTALGAATASSTDEIAEGLEKFAAVADTVGLSYEYATSALATVTATTRQSADIVGNAFKTLFARIEGLNLGETLDDGTDLNKYSKALASVGINIKETDGSLKSMDETLDELGEKWKNLGKDQQVALAQTVGGVRQYTQLIALMDNWDFFQSNLATAKGSEGELQKQADIYAESWEASRDRVKASLEEIYSQLFNDKFFIELNDTLAKLTDFIGDFIDNMGGAKSVFVSFLAFMMNHFKPQMVQAFENIGYSLKMSFGKGKQEIITFRESVVEALTSMNLDSVGKEISQIYTSQASAQEALLRNANKMTESQKRIAQILLEQHGILVENAVEQAKTVKETEKESKQSRTYFESRIKSSAGQRAIDEYNDAIITKNREENRKRVLQNTESEEQRDNLESNATFYATEKTGVSRTKNGAYRKDNKFISKNAPEVAEFENLFDEYLIQNSQPTVKKLLIDETQGTKTKEDIIQLGREYEKVSTQASRLGAVMDEVFNGKGEGEEDRESLIRDLKAIKEGFESDEAAAEFFGQEGAAAIDKALEELENGEGISNVQANAMEARENLEGQADDIDTEVSQTIETDERALEFWEQRKNKIQENAEAEGQLATKQARVVQTGRNLEEYFNNLGKTIKTGAQKIGNLAQTLGNLAMAINIIKGIGNIIDNEDLTFGEKALQIVTSLGMAIPILTSALQSEAVAKVASAVASKAGAVANKLLSESAKEVIISLGPIALIIAGVSAAIMILLSVVKKIQNEKINKKIKESEETTKQFEEALKNATSKAEGLKDAFDSYKEVVKTLDDCTKGTDEWRESIEKVNEQVRQILEEYPELNKITGILSVEDGMLVLDEDKVNEQINTLTTSKDMLQIQAASSQQHTAELKVDRVAQEISSNVAQLSPYTDPFLKFYNENKDNYEVETKEGISKLLDDFGDSVLSIANFSNGFLDKDFDSLIDSFKDLEKAQIDLKNTMDNTNLTIAQSALGGKGYSDEVITLASRNFDELKEEKQSKLKNSLYDVTSVFDSKNKVSDLSDYFEAIGITDLSKVNLGEVTGLSEDTRKVSYTYEGVEYDITQEKYQEALATKQASESLEDFADKIEKKLPELEEKNLKGFALNNNLNDFKEKELKDFREDKERIKEENADDAEAYKKAWQEYVQEVFDIKNDKELADLAAAFGYESTEAFLGGFGKAIEDANEEIEDIPKHIYKTAKEAYSQIIDDKNLTNTAKISVRDILNKAFETNGVEGVQSAKNLLKNLTEDELEALSVAFENVDWNTIGIEELQEILKTAGLSTAFTNEELESFKNLMKDVDKSLINAQEKYKALHSVIDDLKNGATIAAEDMQKLGEEYESYFMTMADGTKKLMIDAQDFYNIVNEQSVKNFEDNLGKIKGMEQFSFDELSQNAAGPTINYLKDLKDLTNEDLLSTQLDFLDYAGYDADKINKWKDSLASDTVTLSELHEISEAVKENEAAYNSLSETEEKLMEQLASTAQTLGDLHVMLEEGKISTEAFTKAALAMDAAEDTKNLDADELKEYTRYLKEAADVMDDFNDNMTDKEARIVAKGIMKMNSAIETLADNFTTAEEDADSWRDVLEKSEVTSKEYAEAITNTRNAVADLLDISAEFVSNDFITDHLDEIEKAATGDAEAIDNLKASLSEDIIAKIIIDNDLDETEVKALYNDIVNAIPDIEVGVTLDENDQFIQALNKLVSETKMTADQVNAITDSMGFETNWASEGQEVKTAIPVYRIHHEPEPHKDGEAWSEVTWTEQLEPDEAVGYTTAFAMTTDGSVPKINSVIKKASGSANNYSSSNAGGKSSPGSKSSKPDKKEHIKDKPDRYYDINNQISEKNAELDKNERASKQLSSIQSHYSGNVLLSSLKDENKLIQENNGLLEDQLHNYEKLYEIQTGELADIKDALKDGEWDGDKLLNYTQLFQANVDKYNAAIDAYNAMSKEEQDATGKQMLEDAKNAYEKRKTYLERYQKLYYNEMINTEKQIAEQRQKIMENTLKAISNNLKAFNLRFQIKWDAHKATREYNSFMKNIQQDFRKVLPDLSIDNKYNKSDFNSFVDDIIADRKKASEIEREIEKMRASKKDGVVQLSDGSIYGSIAEAQEALKEVNQKIQQDTSELQNKFKDLWQTYLDGIDQASKQVDFFTDRISSLNEQLEFEKQLIELIYGDNAYDLLDTYYQEKSESNLRQIELSRQEADVWKKQFYDALEENNANFYDISTWTTDMQTFYEKWQAADKKTRDQILESIKDEQEALENSRKKIFDTFENNLWGTSLDKIKEDWDFMQKKAGNYLDDVQRAYKTQALSNKILQGIDSTSSIKAQQKLAKLRESELEYLREKEHLTQEDIDLAEARYQIALKEIALEEAQSNKNSMKLTRDTSGNWTYQYVADQDDIAQKQQDLADANANLYEMSIAARNKYTQLIFELNDDWRNELQRLNEEKDKHLITEEEYNQKLKEINDKYDAEMEAAAANVEAYRQEAMTATAKIFSDLCDNDKTAYETLTSEQQRLVDEVKTNALEDYEAIRKATMGEETGLYPGIKKAAEDAFSATNFSSQTSASDIIAKWNGEEKGSVKNEMNTCMSSLVSASKKFESSLKDIEEASGVNILGQDGVKGDIEKTGKEIDKTTRKAETFISTIDDNLSSARTEISNLATAWDSVATSTEKAILQLKEYIRTSDNSKSGISVVEENLKKGAGTGAGGNSETNGSGDDGSGDGTPNKKKNTLTSPSTDTTETSTSSDEEDKALYDYLVWLLGKDMVDKFQINANNNGIRLQTYKKLNSYLIDLLRGHPTFLSSRDHTKMPDRVKKGYGIFFDKYGSIFSMPSSTGSYSSYTALGLASGGYTGEWGPEGRLALLHQKELVLNASDTENMLKAVSALRDISSLNSSIEKSITNSLSNMIFNTLTFGKMAQKANSDENAKNNIFNITAEFPNADDVQSIREAILGLPNYVSQLVY